MPIWEVARAISAVPCYFKIATILDQKFRDAGARFKNPSLEAFAEINAVHRQWQKHTDMLIEREALALGDTTQHQTNQQGKCEAGKDGDPKDAIAVFVSIGSGKCPLPSLRLTKPIPVLKTLKGTHLDTAWEAWWNTEITHEAMEKATGKTDAAYYRFDTAGEGVANLEIDEWKMKTQEGKQVNETLEMIERETNRYLGELETETEIQSCAEMLVRFRRGQL